MTAVPAGLSKIAGSVLIGGICAGALLALAVPTAMKRTPNPSRDMIGAKDVASAEDTSIYLEASPQDLTPVYWQGAAQEYPAAGRADWLYTSIEPQQDGLTEAQLDAILYDDAAHPAREQQEVVGPVMDDDAANSAQAASAAAADVRAVESAVITPSAQPEEVGNPALSEV